MPPVDDVASVEVAKEEWIDHNNVVIFRNNSVNPTGSRRYSLTVKAKPSFLGLPKHRRPARVRLFPKRTASSSAVPLAEPSSPKVSCIGRVRSRKKNKAADPAIKAAGFFWTNFRSIFRSKGQKAARPADPEPPVQKKRDFSGRASSSSLTQPPSLGAAKRFSSGRRSHAHINVSV